MVGYGQQLGGERVQVDFVTQADAEGLDRPAAKAARGGFAYGSPAFGHRAAGRALVPDEREQAAIARARELQAAGASPRQIGPALEAEGHRPKRGARWHLTAVARMLKRPR